MPHRDTFLFRPLCRSLPLRCSDQTTAFASVPARECRVSTCPPLRSEHDLTPLRCATGRAAAGNGCTTAAARSPRSKGEEQGRRNTPCRQVLQDKFPVSALYLHFPLSVTTATFAFTAPFPAVCLRVLRFALNTIEPHSAALRGERPPAQCLVR